MKNPHKFIKDELGKILPRDEGNSLRSFSVVLRSTYNFSWRRWQRRRGGIKRGGGGGGGEGGEGGRECSSASLLTETEQTW